ncbi:MAG TPA: oxygenase MpaB family protein [Conexibacter sp.]|nr:oxygenase MpaB family protein [Conexibacter sp.]
MASHALDEGYFPRGRSVLRQVHDERLVGLFFGQRALAIGALQPVNYTGTSQSTGGRERPFRRLVRTANAFETIFFGTRAEADRVLATVHRMHARVQGELAEDAGPFPAGTPFDAFDPELMLWTAAVLADSALYYYELFVRPLDDAERDAFWLDYVRFAELFGMPREVAPPAYAAFRAWWDAKLASDEMHLTDEARRTGRFVALEIPMPAANQLAKRVHDLVMLGSFPPRVRELYGLSWSPAQARAFPLAVAALRGLRSLAPAELRRGSCRRSFALVEQTERGRIERGKPTPQLPPRQAPAAATRARPGSARAPLGSANGAVATAIRSSRSSR